MIPFLFSEDSNGRIGCIYASRQPDVMDFVRLAANTGVTLTIPTNAKHALFSYSSGGLSSSTFIQYSSTTNLTSAVYAATSTGATVVGRAGCGVERNPIFRTLKNVTGLSIISGIAGDVSISWFG